MSDLAAHNWRLEIAAVLAETTLLSEQLISVHQLHVLWAKAHRNFLR